MSHRNAIRAILNLDRIWSVYALGDLQPGQFECCTWTVHGESLALLYRGFETPVLFVTGVPGPWLLNALCNESRVYLHVRPDSAAVLEDHYELKRQPMWSMALPREAPGFYDRGMIDRGTFFGIRSDSELVAVAGTHLVSDAEKVAAIGNVYTRRDCRGRGLAASTTSAVVNELIGRGIDTIALNVAVANTAAHRLYHRLGFVEYCQYYEGVASR